MSLIYGPLAVHEGAETECMVCLSEIGPGDSVFVNTPTCKHELHESCAREWAAMAGNRVNCPLCRGAYTAEDKSLLGVVPMRQHDSFLNRQTPERLAMEQEATARFAILNEELQTVLDGATEQEIVDGIIKTVIFDSEMFAVHNVYLFATIMTNHVEDFQYFVTHEHWLHVRGGDLIRFEATPRSCRLLEIFITTQFLKAAVQSVPYPDAEFGTEELADAALLSNTVLQDVSAFPSTRGFVSRWLSYILRRPVDSERQRAIARACLHFVHNKIQAHGVYYWSWLFA